MNSEARTRFGKYELLATIETASMATLAKALDTETRRTVLLRVMSRSASENPALARFYDALQNSEVHHVDDANILRLLEVGQVDKQYYMAFEFMEGEPLSRLMTQRRFSVEEALAIVRHVAEGLRALHQRHIVHGDVKPANILVGKDARGQFAVKLAPVDLAASATEGMISIYGELVGSPRYMAPEQIEGKPISPRADIYALGIVAYELLANRPAFEVKSTLGYLRAHCDEDPIPLAQLDTALPVEISLVVQKMIARDPRMRYRNSQSLIDDLYRVEMRMAGHPAEAVPADVDSVFAARAQTPVVQPRASLAGRIIMTVFAVVTGLLIGAVAFLSMTVADLRAELARVTRSPSPKPTTLPATAPPRTTNLAEEAYKSLSQEVERLLQNKEFDEATRRLERFAAEHANSVWAEKARTQMARALFARAEALEASGDLAGALTCLQRLTSEFADSSWTTKATETIPALLYKQYQQALASQNWTEAERHLQVIMREYPQAPVAETAASMLPRLLVEWAEDALQRVQPEEAAARLRRVIEEFPRSDWAKQAASRLPQAELRAAQRLVGAGKFQEAIMKLAAIQKSYPGSGEAVQAMEERERVLVQWAQMLMEQGKIEEALEKREQLEKEFPRGRWARSPSGDLAELARVARELRVRAAASGEPVTPMAILFTYATELMQSKKESAALTWYRKLIARYPNSPEARRAAELASDHLFAQAQKFMQTAELKSAWEILKQVAEEFPDSKSGVAAAAEVKLLAQTPKGMVFIPGGSFVMGSDLEELFALGEKVGLVRSVIKGQYGSETPRRQMSLPGFYIDRTEVTNAEYKRFIDATNHPPPPSPAWNGRDLLPGFADHPVTHVSYEDAEAYARWAGKRLPTEEEWEKAARGPDGRRYPWGNEFDLKRANLKGSGKDGTAPVGSFPAGASPYDALDMVGNVWEWTASNALPYPGSEGARLNPQWKVTRGASYEESAALDATATVRFPRDPSTRSPSLGFRCVLSIERDTSAKITE